MLREWNPGGLSLAAVEIDLVRVCSSLMAMTKSDVTPAS
jgi:hypothetical protein